MMAAPPPTAARRIPGTALGRPATASAASSGRTAGADTHTSAIYGLLEQRMYAEALQAIAARPGVVAGSRAALSLTAHCCYELGDFAGAAQAYGELAAAFPHVADEALYTLHHAQCLYRAGLLPEALQACQRVDAAGGGAGAAARVQQLHAALAYARDDVAAAKAALPQLPPSAPGASPRRVLDAGGGMDAASLLTAHACVAYKEGRFDESRALYEAAAAQSAPSFRADLAYNVALCHYCTRAFGPALRAIASIVDRAALEHPELRVAAGGLRLASAENSDGALAPRSVALEPALHASAVVEALNLRAAIQYELRDEAAARDTLARLPPRLEEELDPVTLHNAAVMRMDADPATGFRMLNFLLSSPPFPPETFGNLLLLYVKYGCHDLAADVMAENAALTYELLDAGAYDFLDATIMAQTSHEAAFAKFEALGGAQLDALRRLQRSAADARAARDAAALKAAVQAHRECLEALVPVLMGQAKLLWDRALYASAERLLRGAGECAGESDTWQLNLAHAVFMQEGRFADAASLYEPVVRKHWDSILDVTAIALANLCVAHIMTNANDEAEEIMRRIEEEEARQSADTPERVAFHLCIVNLVVGTLYCSKGNFEFGISRVIKAMHPLERKLGTDTWYYAKRCFLALAEGAAKHTVTLSDSLFCEVCSFLDAAEAHGKAVATVVTRGAITGEDTEADLAAANVSTEARLIKHVFLLLQQ